MVLSHEAKTVSKTNLTAIFSWKRVLDELT